MGSASRQVARCCTCSCFRLCHRSAHTRSWRNPTKSSLLSIRALLTIIGMTLRRLLKATASLSWLMLSVLNCSRNTPVSPPTWPLVPGCHQKSPHQQRGHQLHGAWRRRFRPQLPMHHVPGDWHPCQIAQHPLSMQIPLQNPLALMIPLQTRERLLCSPIQGQQEPVGVSEAQQGAPAWMLLALMSSSISGELESVNQRTVSVPTDAPQSP